MLPPEAVLTIVCGSNEKLHEKLQLAYLTCPNVHVEGLVTDMPLYMRSADLFMTKPGGRQFVDAMNVLYKERKKGTNLKIQRQKAGLSQKELAELAGIPIRTIQQYEQRQKNINKAQVQYLIALSKVLCCEISDLVEYLD